MLTQKKSLVDEAKKSRILPNVILALILIPIFLTVGSIVGTVVTHLIMSLFKRTSVFIENKELISSLATLVTFAFTSFTVFLWVKFAEKRKIASIGLQKDHWFKKYVIGFLIGLALMSVVVLILFMLGYIEIETKAIQPVGASAIVPILVILIGWIIQGATEEILTRGWLMNVLGAKYNIAFGLILSSIVFGLLHLSNDNINYIAILNIMLSGALFGLFTIKTNSLWIACGMHTAWNFAQGNLFGFEVSGQDFQIGSLIDFNSTGHDLITGGVFGPEAGLASTFVLVSCILIIFFLDKKGVFAK
jgi:hypothetical protein